MKHGVCWKTAIILGMLSILAVPRIDASKQTFGKLTFNFTEPPAPNAPWKLTIQAVPWLSFDDGYVQVWMKSHTYPDSGFNNLDKIWSGGAAKFDTITLVHTVAPPPPGLYYLSVTLLPFPDGVSGTQQFGKQLCVDVRQDTVLTSGGTFTTIWRDEIYRELEARGLKSASDEELKRVAPDLAERLRGIYERAGLGRPHFEGDSTEVRAPVSLPDDTGGDNQDLEPKKPGTMRHHAEEPADFSGSGAEKVREPGPQPKEPYAANRTPSESIIVERSPVAVGTTRMDTVAIRRLNERKGKLARPTASDSSSDVQLIRGGNDETKEDHH